MAQIATDPPVSEAQRRAMWAAKSGHSTLGIPSSVGAEFAEADPGGKLPEKVGKDLSPRKWSVLKRLFGEWMDEEEAEPEHQRNGAQDNWERKGRAASVAFTTDDGRVLLLRRSPGDSHHAGQWCFPGGQAADGEEFAACARREATEEIGDCSFDGLSELDRARTPGDFEHVTFVVPVSDAFEPELSPEHDDWTWAPVTDMPEHVHPGVKTTIDKVIGPDALGHASTMPAARALRSQVRDGFEIGKRMFHAGGNDDETEEAKKRAQGELSETTREKIGTAGSEHREDMPESVFLLPSERKYPVKEKRDGEWKYTRALLLAAARRARMQGKPELASRADKIREREFGSAEQGGADMALDWSGCAQLVDGIVVGSAVDVEFAYDRASSRSYDADGHLHVRDVNIAKASVNGYLGKEVPDWKGLGLDPDKKYRLWRHPDELKRAVPTANGKPILNDHEAIDAETHNPSRVVGSIGTDARWDDPFVKSTIVFWPAVASREIENNTRRALSPAYRYKPDMTPGRTPDGESYDGVMRDISFSHLAQIPEGRQGPDIVVSDAALGGEQEDEMVQLSPKAAVAVGMFLGHYGPKLKASGMAMDTATALFAPIWAGTTSKNFSAQRPALDAALRAALKGKLASDADIMDVTELLQAIEGVEAGADTTTEANAGLPPYMREEEDDADDETEEEREEDEGCDRRARDARRRMGRDETEEECERREEEEADDDLPPGGELDTVTGTEPKLIGDRRRRADDRRRRADDRRLRRAADARRRMGRDESEEEREEREKREAAEDRVRARDRRHLGRDYRHARDAHRMARDAHRKAVADWRRASDGHRSSMDASKADDAARFARDMKRADDECRDAHARLVKARDIRHRARDARRAHDRRYGRDEPPPFEGRPNTGGTMDKAAMDAAIQKRVDEAVRENNKRHREIVDALRTVRSKAGEIAMDSSINNAADVFDRALTVLGIEHAGIRETTALKRLFEVAPRPGGEQRVSGFAQDAAPASSYSNFTKRFPGAANIEQI